MADLKGKPWLRKPAAGDIIALRQGCALAEAGLMYVRVTHVNGTSMACEPIAGTHRDLDVPKSDFSHIIERADNGDR